MTLMRFVRRLFKKERGGQRLEYVKETIVAPALNTMAPAVEPPAHEPLPPPIETLNEEEIAFSPQGDLEAYVKGLAVSKEAIERWISAGVLLPEETKVATKMIRIMCKNNKPKAH